MKKNISDEFILEETTKIQQNLKETDAKYLANHMLAKKLYTVLSRSLPKVQLDLVDELLSTYNSMSCDEQIALYKYLSKH